MQRIVIIMKSIMIWFIKFYRKYISPLKTTKCPYFPSCSEYGLEAIQKYGALKGGLLTHYGTGSYPPFEKGLHLIILHIVSNPPFKAPCFCIASSPYSEQDGK